MRLVFMGTPAFAVPTLHALLNSEFTVAGVVCQPDRPSGRGKKIQIGPVKALAMAKGIPVVQPEKMKDPAFLGKLQTWKPEAIVVAAFGRILPETILDLPPKGCLNVHGSLLPKYRGAAPIQWALIRGETETGITIMLMDKGMDTGPILRQEAISIGPDETAEELSGRMAQLGGALLVPSLREWLAGIITPYPQEESEATLAPLLKKEDGVIQWNRPADSIANHIRGLTPWPGAFTFFHQERWVIWKAKVADLEAGVSHQGHKHLPVPGEITAVDKQGLYVQTGQGQLHIMEIQPENKKRMKIVDYVSGHRLEPGMSFSLVKTGLGDNKTL